MALDNELIHGTEFLFRFFGGGGVPILFFNMHPLWINCETRFKDSTGVEKGSPYSQT